MKTSTQLKALIRNLSKDKDVNLKRFLIQRVRGF